MPAEFIYQVAVSLLAAGAVYGGIRSDLKSQHEEIARAQKMADWAHHRINEHLERRDGK